MIIAFNKFGSSVGTRAIGQEVRTGIETAIREGQQIIFDFAGVEVVSNSFADECFGKLLLTFDLDTIRRHTTFKNTTPFVRDVVRFSLNQRLGHLAHS